MALPDDETLPKPEWMLKVEFAEASPPELSADATAGLVEVGLNHVATLTATPCPGPAILMSEAAASADVDPGMPTQHQPSCSLTDKEDRGLTIETQPGLDLGVTRLQLFRPVGLGSSPALEVELIPLGPSHLAVVAGKSLDQETEIVTWPENPVDLQILNGTSYRLRSAEQGRVVARGVNGKEARASLRWQRAPATLFRSVRLKKLSARLSAASQFAWLDQNYDYAHGELTITAPDLEATIGSGCDGKCIEVRYTAGQATLEARGIPIEKRGPGWKKLQAAAAAAGLALGFLGLLL